MMFHMAISKNEFWKRKNCELLYEHSEGSPAPHCMTVAVLGQQTCRASGGGSHGWGSVWASSRLRDGRRDLLTSQLLKVERCAFLTLMSTGCWIWVIAYSMLSVLRYGRVKTLLATQPTTLIANSIFWMIHISFYKATYIVVVLNG